MNESASNGTDAAADANSSGTHIVVTGAWAVVRVAAAHSFKE